MPSPRREAVGRVRPRPGEGLRQGKGLAPATEFYTARRRAMDAGAVVAWPERFDPKTEVSAVQHAMNLKLRMKRPSPRIPERAGRGAVRGRTAHGR